MPIDDEWAVESGCAGCRRQQSDLAGDQSLNRCSRCRCVSYCSKECQTAHWTTHKPDCKRPNYVIEAWVCKSQIVNSPVRRVLSCPATAPFEKLHHALQIAFSWANTHGWDFVVKDPDYDPGDGEVEFQRMMRKMYRMGFMETGDSNDPREYLLRIRAPEDPMGQMLKVDLALGHARREHPRTPEKTSTKIKLYEVFDKPEYRDCEWAYTYDFGDNWEHDIKLIDRTRPTSHFSCVGGEGTGIAEDAGGARGWEELKEAYRADNPTEEQKKKMYWYETHASNANRDGLRGGRADRWSKAQVNRLLAEAGL